MNILSGLSMAVAGVGMARKFFGAIKPSDLPEGVAIKRLEPGEGRTGKALEDYFAFSRGFLNWRRAPSVQAFRNVNDLVEDYLTNGVPGVSPEDWSKLPDRERQVKAQERAAADWSRVAPKQIPRTARPVKEEPLIVSDAWGAPTKPTTSIAASRKQWVFRPDRGFFLMRPGDFSRTEQRLRAAQRRLATASAEIVGLQRLYREATGAELDAAAVTACDLEKAFLDPSIRDACSRYPKAISQFRIEDAKVKTLQDALKAEVASKANDDLVSSAKALQQRLKDEGIEESLIVVRPGVVQVKGGFRSSIPLTMTAKTFYQAQQESRRINEAARRLEQEARAKRYQFATSRQQLPIPGQIDYERLALETADENYIPPEALKAFFDAQRAVEAQLMETRRKTLSASTARPRINPGVLNERIRRIAEELDLDQHPERAKEFMARVNEARNQLLTQSIEEQIRSAAAVRGEMLQSRGGELRREFVPTRRMTRKERYKGGTNGMDDASGMTAPEIAVVDGLGMNPEDAGVGLFSVALIAVGAITLYKLMDAEPDVKT